MNFPQIEEMDNQGGNLQFYYLPVNNVSLIPRAVNGTVLSEISLKDIANWFLGYSTNDLLSFESQLVSNEHGSYYENTVKGFYPKPSATFIEYLYDVRHRKFILLVMDSNGRLRIVGSVEQPCTLTFVEKTGTRAQDLPGVSFEFRCENYNPCYFYPFTPFV
jgi:hypothetical protein